MDVDQVLVTHPAGPPHDVDELATRVRRAGPARERRQQVETRYGSDPDREPVALEIAGHQRSQLRLVLDHHRSLAGHRPLGAPPGAAAVAATCPAGSSTNLHINTISSPGRWSQHGDIVDREGADDAQGTPTPSTALAGTPSTRTESTNHR
jgi:hypothetical protein